MYYGIENKANGIFVEYAPIHTTKTIEVGEFNLGDGGVVVSSDVMRRDVNGLPLGNADTTSVFDADDTDLVEKTDRDSSASEGVASHPRLPLNRGHSNSVHTTSAGGIPVIANQNSRRSSKYVFYDL